MAIGGEANNNVTHRISNGNEIAREISDEAAMMTDRHSGFRRSGFGRSGLDVRGLDVRG